MNSKLFLGAAFALLVTAAACGDSTGTGGTGGSGGSTSTNNGGTDTGGTPSTGGDNAGGDNTGGVPSTGGTSEGGGGGGSAEFDMSFDGSGFTPHNGKNLYVQVRDAGGAVVASDMTVVEGGNFTFTFTGIAAEGGNVDYYADVNDDADCTNGTDHVWRVPVPANHMLVVTHNTTFSTEACDGF